MAMNDRKRKTMGCKIAAWMPQRPYPLSLHNTYRLAYASLTAPFGLRHWRMCALQRTCCMHGRIRLAATAPATRGW